MEYLFANHDSILYTLAGIMLILELTVMGMSGPLLFVAIGCLVTGILVTNGIINTWEMEVLWVAVISLISALILWKPLKKLQGETRNVADTSSDMIGQIVKTSTVVSLSGGSIRYSGIDWQARLQRASDEVSATEISEIDAGESVEIIGVDGTTMIVKPVI